MHSQKRVAVIGAGIGGLAAAHRLHELDPSLDLALFESSDHVGGVIRTESYQGFRIEHGPDSLLTQIPWGLEICHRLGIDRQLIQTSSTHHGVYVVCRGRLRRMPDGLALMAPQRLWPVFTSSILSLRGKLRLACEPLVARRDELTDESLTQFVTRRLGREAFERLVQPLLSGMYMGSPDCLSVRATFPRFVEMEAAHGSLMRAMRRRESGDGSRASAGGPRYSMFVAPREGMELLPQALAARLPNGTVRLECRVDDLARVDSGWQIITTSTTGERHLEMFDAVVVATSAPAAARLLHDAASALSAEFGAIEHTSCIVVNLAFSRDHVRHPLDAFGFVTPLVEQRLVTACTFSSVKYPGRAPEGSCLMRAFLGGAANPEALDWSDRQIKHVVLEELGELLEIRGEPLFCKVQRWRRAMPQYEVGHVERVDRIERLVMRRPGLAVAGNAFRGVGITHCIHSGELAAQRLHDYLQAETPMNAARS